jgi:hypothetical protein
LGFYDWMLALHILAAFSIAAALVLYGVMVVSGRRMTTLDETRRLFPIARIGGPLIGVGMGLTLLLGIVLAIDSEQFAPWDPWIIAAVILWALAGWAGGKSGVYYTDVQKRAESGGEGAEADVVGRLRAPAGARLYAATVALFVLLLLDMIFKPGA